MRSVMREGVRGRGPLRVRCHSHERENVEDRLGLVEGVEVDARSTRVQDGVNEAGSEGRAELVAALLLLETSQCRQKLFGDLDTGEVLDAAQARRIRGRQQAGNNRDSDAGATGALDEGRVNFGVPEQLRDREGRTRRLLDEEALDLLLGRRARRRVTRWERGDRNGQGLEGGAQGLARVSVAAASFDRADEMNEFRRARDTARAGFPVLLPDRRVSAQKVRTPDSR